jgi:hypothetical protein
MPLSTIFELFRGRPVSYGEKHYPATSQTDFYHNVVLGTPRNLLDSN